MLYVKFGCQGNNVLTFYIFYTVNSVSCGRSNATFCTTTRRCIFSIRGFGARSKLSSLKGVFGLYDVTTVACSYKRPGYWVIFKMMARKMESGFLLHCLKANFVRLGDFFELQNKVSTRNLYLVLTVEREKVFSAQVAQALFTKFNLLVQRVIKCTK